MLRADHAQNESHQKNTESGQPIYASVKIVFLAPSNKTAKRFYFGIVNLFSWHQNARGRDTVEEAESGVVGGGDLVAFDRTHFYVELHL